MKEIHKKVFPVLRDHKEDQNTYNVQAPLFILNNPSYDWKGLKQELYTNVLAANTHEDAFQIYKSKCLEMFFGAAVVEAK